MIKNEVLIVDDEPNALKVLSAILSKQGYDIIQSSSIERACQIIQQNTICAVITDIKLRDNSGIELFEFIKKNHYDIPVIFLTAYGTVDSAVHAMTHGAFYYFIKPPDYQKLKSIVKRAIEYSSLKKEVNILRNKITQEKKQYHFIGNAPQILEILNTVEAVKNTRSSVLISGETGTGKELIACILHYSSKIQNKPFIPVNCAAIPKELLESELFGYEKGAFTGAVSKRIGKIEESSGGTLFLDEIGELDQSLQAKLLRVLEENILEMLGSNKQIKVNFRLISSTNRDLREMIHSGQFRSDLFYRINVIHLTLPPLRERIEDLPLLVSKFQKEFCARENKFVNFSDSTLDIFKQYHWPGNIRELKNIVERLIVLSKSDTITLNDLPREFLSEKSIANVSFKESLEKYEAQTIENILLECKGNISQAAKMLGISRKTFYKRLDKHKINKSVYFGNN